MARAAMRGGCSMKRRRDGIEINTQPEEEHRMSLGQQRGQTTERRQIMRKRIYRMVFVFVLITAAWGAVDALAQPIVCSSKADQVTAMTDPAGHVINTNFQ